jgi:hypothetical protein
MRSQDESKELAAKSAERLSQLIRLKAPETIIASEFALLSERVREFLDDKVLERQAWNMKTMNSRCDYPGDVAGEG